MNPREAASLIAIVSAAYPQWPANRETVAIYADALADIPYDIALNAVRDLILTEDRWPTIATIRRQVAIRLHQLAPTPLEAWAEVHALAQTGGANSAPNFTHSAIGQTVAAIGWWEITRSTNPETMRAQFLRLYSDSRQQHDHEILSTIGALTHARDHIIDGSPVAPHLTATA